MMPVAPGTKVFLSCKPLDMRKGFDGLSAQVATVIKMDPFADIFLSSAESAVTMSKFFTGMDLDYAFTQNV